MNHILRIKEFYSLELNQYGEDVPKISGGLTFLAAHVLGGVALDLTTFETAINWV